MEFLNLQAPKSYVNTWKSSFSELEIFTISNEFD